MKRLELFEFEDFAWLPDAIRSGVTNLIIVLHRMMGTSDVIAAIISRIKTESKFQQITDMGSGSGGPMIEVIGKVNNKSKSPIPLLLTDYHPNPEIVNHINSQNIPYVQYHDTSVDATEIHSVPTGLKTMVASFHHMNPKKAKQILQSAEQSQEPILIYEIAKNNVPVLLWWLLLPISLLILIIMSWAMTPFIRPLTFTQIIFTYLIPIIPIIYAWDGQASLMRTYTFADIEELIGEKDSINYKWTIEDATKSNGKKLGYYISGWPK